MVSLVESVQEEAQPVAEEQTNEKPPVVAVRRRTIDAVLVGAGAVIAIVLAVAGSLLTWGSNFANDYVGKELTSQHINFPDRASLEKEGRQDLVGYAGQQVTTGTDARAYASFIAHHLDGIANGATYADLGAPESAAKARRPGREGRRSEHCRGRRAAGQGRRHHQPAQHPLQGRDAAGAAALDLRLVDDRPDRRHRRHGRLRRRRRDDGCS